MTFAHEIGMPEIDNLFAGIIYKDILDKGTNQLWFHTHHFFLCNFNMKYVQKSSIESNLRKINAKTGNLIVINTVCQVDMTVCKETSGQISKQSIILVRTQDLYLF